MKPFKILKMLLPVGCFLVLAMAERKRPLRDPVESKRRREARNLAMAGITAVVLSLTQEPLLKRVAPLVERRRWGVLNRVPMPDWTRTAAGVVLLDYTLYIWHFLTHRLPRLWRFHLVHHADLDLDTSTALRFHFGEMIFSIGWRVGQVGLLGISPRALEIWRTALPISVMFHHSNVRLPLVFEKRLSRFVVTPRMHGIHHSVVEGETHSNWSSGLTVWDRLHGTMRLDVPQDKITIGVPAYREPQAVTLPRLLVMPFERQPHGRRTPAKAKPVRG